MNKKMTLTLSLVALLGSGLLLPGAASAHGHADDHRSKNAPPHRHVEHHYQQGKEWYLLRHKEMRSYGYRPVERIYRTTEIHHHDTVRYISEPAHREQHSPVGLVIRYEVTL